MIYFGHSNYARCSHLANIAVHKKLIGWGRSVRCLYVGCFVFAALNSANAQFDPRYPLGSLISAFQTCGPPQVYQMLSPSLFQIVSIQTGGRGCYQNIANAGPVTAMQVLNVQSFPIGPLYDIRVQHQNLTVDWSIGFNQFTQKIEYLNFRSPTGGPPPQPRPLPPGPQPQPPTTGGPSPQPPTGSSGCTKYPAMCAN